MAAGDDETTDITESPGDGPGTTQWKRSEFQRQQDLERAEQQRQQERDRDRDREQDGVVQGAYQQAVDSAKDSAKTAWRIVAVLILSLIVLTALVLERQLEINALEGTVGVGGE